MTHSYLNTNFDYKHTIWFLTMSKSWWVPLTSSQCYMQSQQHALLALNKRNAADHMGNGTYPTNHRWQEHLVSVYTRGYQAYHTPARHNILGRTNNCNKYLQRLICRAVICEEGETCHIKGSVFLRAKPATCCFNCAWLPLLPLPPQTTTNPWPLACTRDMAFH